MDTYEKKYKGALNWMREMYPGLHGATKEDAEHYFPELRESENEKTRKRLIKFISDIKKISESGRNSWAIRKDDVEMCNAFLAYLEKQKEQPKEELVYRLNGLMQEYIKEGKDDMEKEHRFKCYQLFWDSLEDTSYFEQKEQKPISFNEPYNLNNYEAVMEGNATSLKQKKQKPAEKEITLTSFEEALNNFLFNFVNSTIEDCEPKEYVKKHSAKILKAAYKELNAKLQQDIFEAQQEGRREGYEVAKAEQKPAEKQDYSELNDLERAIHRGFIFAGVENVPVAIIKETANECKRIANENANAEWSEEDKSFYDSIMCEVVKEGMHPTPEQANWLKSLPERFNFQSKQEWSEEDKEILEKLHRLLVICRGEKKFIQEADYNKMDNLLKSLRPQPHWKPSKEQIATLEKWLKDKQFDGASRYVYHIFESLYEQLKKLM